VGTLGEEAAKLLGALQGWAREAGSEHAGTTGSAQAAVAAAFARVNEHVGAGGEDCRYCPVCRAIAAFRQTSPEVRQHLASAAASLVQAAADAMVTPVPDRGSRRPDAPVQRIDLDDPDDPEDD
jgi:hypothetical protein